MWLRQSALLTWPPSGAATGPICLSDTGQFVRARVCAAGQEVVRVNYLGRKVTDWSIYLSFIGFSSEFIADPSYITSLQSSIINCLGLPVWWVSSWAFSRLCCWACVNVAHCDILPEHDDSRQIKAGLLRWGGVTLIKSHTLLRLHWIVSLNSGFCQ